MKRFLKLLFPLFLLSLCAFECGDEELPPYMGSWYIKNSTGQMITVTLNSSPVNIFTIYLQPGEMEYLCGSSYLRQEATCDQLWLKTNGHGVRVFIHDENGELVGRWVYDASEGSDDRFFNISNWEEFSFEDVNDPEIKRWSFEIKPEHLN